MDYDGLTKTWPRQRVSIYSNIVMLLRVSGLFGRQVKGLTMVDTEMYYAEVTSEVKPALGEVGDGPDHGVSVCLCDVCLRSQQRPVRPKSSRYSDYENLYPETTNSLTDHQYFLCSGAVRAFVFKSRTWGKSLPIDCSP